MMGVMLLLKSLPTARGRNASALAREMTLTLIKVPFYFVLLQSALLKFLFWELLVGTLSFLRARYGNLTLVYSECHLHSPGF